MFVVDTNLPTLKLVSFSLSEEPISSVFEDNAP